MKRIIYGWALVLLCACSPQNEREKHQGSRSEVLPVKDKVVEIDTGEDVLIGRRSRTISS